MTAFHTFFINYFFDYSGIHHKATTNSVELCFALVNATPLRVLPRYAHSEAWGVDAPCTSNDPNLGNLRQSLNSYVN